MQKTILILDNIRSVQNVGAIFRTSDACGISKVICGGYTPCPIDRFGRKRKDLHKSALGAEEIVEWEHQEDIIQYIKDLKQEGYKIVSVEQDKRSVDYKDFKISEKLAVVVGNENDGVSKEILDLSDDILEIPMKGKKESLNVSVATGVLLFRILNV